MHGFLDSTLLNQKNSVIDITKPLETEEVLENLRKTHFGQIFRIFHFLNTEFLKFQNFHLFNAISTFSLYFLTNKQRNKSWKWIHLNKEIKVEGGFIWRSSEKRKKCIQNAEIRQFQKCFLKDQETWLRVAKDPNWLK